MWMTRVLGLKAIGGQFFPPQWEGQKSAGLPFLACELDRRPPAVPVFQ